MIGDQSPISRRPVADCTVFIYENALHKLQEVLERAVLWLTFQHGDTTSNAVVVSAVRATES